MPSSNTKKTYTPKPRVAHMDQFLLWLNNPDKKAPVPQGWEKLEHSSSTKVSRNTDVGKMRLDARLAELNGRPMFLWEDEEPPKFDYSQFIGPNEWRRRFPMKTTRYTTRPTPLGAKPTPSTSGPPLAKPKPKPASA